MAQAAAFDINSHPRPSEPKLDLNSRESMIRWLVWNDRNGVYRDEDCDIEGYPRLTLTEARALVFDIVEDAR